MTKEDIQGIKRDAGNVLIAHIMAAEEAGVIEYGPTYCRSIASELIQLTAMSKKGWRYQDNNSFTRLVDGIGARINAMIFELKGKI